MDQWRAAREAQGAAGDGGPMGECLGSLRALLPSKRPDARTEGTPQRARTPVGAGWRSRAGASELASASPRPAAFGSQDSGATESQVLDLPALRRIVGAKEEQLAALHRKIRFLTEPGP